MDGRQEQENEWRKDETWKWNVKRLTLQSKMCASGIWIKITSWHSRSLQYPREQVDLHELSF